MTMFNKTTQSFRFGDHDVTLETGEIARQATAAVICRMDDTVVLATVVCKKEAKPVRTSSRLRLTTLKRPTQPAASPGASSNAKAVPRKRKR